MASLKLLPLFTYLLEMLFIICPFLLTFPRERKFSRPAVAGIFGLYMLGVFFLGLWFSALLESAQLRHIPFIAVIVVSGLLFCWLITRMDIRIIIYTVFLYRNFVDTARIVSLFVNSLRYAGRPTYRVGMSELYVYVVALSLLVGIAYFLLHRYLVRAVDLTRPLFIWNYFPLVPLSLFLLFRLLGYNTFSRDILYYTDYDLLPSIGWGVCMFTVHAVMLKGLAETAENQMIRERFRTSELLANAQREQMRRLQQSLERSRQTRHDARHHLAAVMGLLDHGQTDEARHYLTDCLTALTPIGVEEYTSNAAVNALLCYYLDQAQSNGVKTTVDIRLPDELPLPEIDFCTILGNLLENAVEACLRQTDTAPRIEVRAAISGRSMLSLIIQNTYSHPIRSRDGLFLSSKRSGFGVGTASVRSLVERHNGILKYEYHDGIFVASLLLNPSMK